MKLGTGYYRAAQRDMNRLHRSLIRHAQQSKALRPSYRPYRYKRRFGL